MLALVGRAGRPGGRVPGAAAAVAVAAAAVVAVAAAMAAAVLWPFFRSKRLRRPGPVGAMVTTFLASDCRRVAALGEARKHEGWDRLPGLDALLEPSIQRFLQAFTFKKLPK